jgi:hypothetical protein
MPTLKLHNDFQAVRKLPFCYLCGRTFEAGDELDRDHVPPKAAFASSDRNPPLILRTHRACNGRHSVEDKRAAQLIGIRRRVSPSSARDEALRFHTLDDLDAYPMTGVTNLDVDMAIGDGSPAFTRRCIASPFHRGEACCRRHSREPTGSRLARLVPQHSGSSRSYQSTSTLLAFYGQITPSIRWTRSRRTTGSCVMSACGSAKKTLGPAFLASTFTAGGIWEAVHPTSRRGAASAPIERSTGACRLAAPSPLPSRRCRYSRGWIPSRHFSGIACDRFEASEKLSTHPACAASAPTAETARETWLRVEERREGGDEAAEGLVVSNVSGLLPPR